MLLLLHNDGAHALTCDRTEVTVLSIVDFVFLQFSCSIIFGPLSNNISNQIIDFFNFLLIIILTSDCSMSLDRATPAQFCSSPLLEDPYESIFVEVRSIWKNTKEFFLNMTALILHVISDMALGKTLGVIVCREEHDPNVMSSVLGWVK